LLGWGFGDWLGGKAVLTGSSQARAWRLGRGAGGPGGGRLPRHRSRGRGCSGRIRLRCPADPAFALPRERVDQLAIAALQPAAPAPATWNQRYKTMSRRATKKQQVLLSAFLLVLSCHIRAPCWANAPRWGGLHRCWPAAPLPPSHHPAEQVYLGLLVVQAVTRVSLSFRLSPRLVNAVSLRKQSNFLCL
jgi:hypothetical protein